MSTDSLNLFGMDLFGEPIAPAIKPGKLAEDFVVPPFSVLDARQGYWQERKRAWLALGIKSELGRGANTLGLSAECEAYRNGNGDYSKSGAVEPVDGGGLAAGLVARRKREKAARTEGSGGPGTLDEQRRQWEAERRGGLLAEAEQAASPGLNHYRDANKHTASLKTGHTEGVTCGPYDQRAGQEASAAESGTSIFDPVLCECAYRWFCPPAGGILDPFAGGSVRGIVAAKLGFAYTGIDLRPEQNAANEAQAQTIVPDAAPRWVTGDSRNVAALAPGAYDFVFSCPPYFDLEVYSDDPADLSNAKDYTAFIEAYRAIVAACCGMLKPNRFACFVVGDIRDGKGYYRNFVGDTISAFYGAGMLLYNEAILVTQVGSLPVRVGRQFPNYRKLGKTHQNVLVFFKGNPAAIKGLGAALKGLV